MARPISAASAKALLHSGSEVAFLDVRESAAFGEGHPLFAAPCPYSRLELLAGALVPRMNVPILLIDDGDSIADLAARRLEACGYTDVQPISGGMEAWAKAGFSVFAGVNVPSKTLGELLDHTLHPEVIDAATLSAWQSQKRPFHFFDVRPPREYAKMRIPGARCIPNGELAHRFAALVPDSSTPVVVSCAGRTRGLIGALGLKLAQVPNPVLTLENGTQGWALAGLPLQRGARADTMPTLDRKAMAISRARADRILAEEEVAQVAPEEVAQLVADADRTTFVFDLRTAAEQTDCPVAGAQTVLAGQLVQATDSYMAVRRARVVLIDDAGLRAATTAIWLRALGYHPLVARLNRPQRLALPQPWAPSLPPLPRTVSPSEARRLADGGVIVCDLRSSERRDEAAIEGVAWSIRSCIRHLLPAGAETVIAVTDSPGAASLAAVDLREAGIELLWLRWDPEALRRAGWRIVESPVPLSRETAVDRVWFVHDRHDGNRDASLQYLAWEQGLVDQLDKQERREFR